MSLDIHSKLLILVLVLTWPFDQVNMYNALAKWTLHIEAKAQMLSAPPISLSGAADIAIASPA